MAAKKNPGVHLKDNIHLLMDIYVRHKKLHYILGQKAPIHEVPRIAMATT